jgi:hypothetical protein
MAGIADASLELDVPLQSLCVEAFNELLKKHGRRVVVENPLTSVLASASSAL